MPSICLAPSTFHQCLGQPHPRSTLNLYNFPPFPCSQPPALILAEQLLGALTSTLVPGCPSPPRRQTKLLENTHHSSPFQVSWVKSQTSPYRLPGLCDRAQDQFLFLLSYNLQATVLLPHWPPACSLNTQSSTLPPPPMHAVPSPWHAVPCFVQGWLLLFPPGHTPVSLLRAV